jgi:hypothetical protein
MSTVALCPKLPQQGALVLGLGMSDDLIVASLGPKHCGLHLTMKREYRDKGEHQSNGQFNSSTVPVRFRSRQRLHQMSDLWQVSTRPTSDFPPALNPSCTASASINSAAP